MDSLVFEIGPDIMTLIDGPVTNFLFVEITVAEHLVLSEVMTDNVLIRVERPPDDN